MKQITVNVFTFEELSDDAKETARDNWREYGLFDDWCNCVYDDFHIIARILGFTVTDKQFSGFCSPRDGASFEGSYKYSKGCVNNIKKYAPEDSTLQDIARDLQRLQAHFFYRLESNITRMSSLYSHSGTMSVDTGLADGGCEWSTVDDSVIAELRDITRALADWLYTTLEREYEWLTSDKTVNSHLCEYDFFTSGEIA